MQLRGAWIIELAELGSFPRSDRERAKAFISQQRERFRPPYGHRLVNHPRQCVFIGTTNSDAWLLDETGGRRFWPVVCRRSIDLTGLQRDRDQIWAEAFLHYKNGERWWLEDPNLVKDAIEEQRGRYFEDVWHEKVLQILDEETLRQEDSRGQVSVSIPEILQRLGVDVARQDQAAAIRVARCLRGAGWERFKGGRRDDREWRYRRVSQL